MSSAEAAIEIVEIDHVEIAIEPWQWGFSLRRRDEIDSSFANRLRQQPALWNGRTFMLRNYTVHNGVIRGASFENRLRKRTSLARLGLCRRQRVQYICLRGVANNRRRLSPREMAPSTAAAGLRYFPSGNPIAQDVDRNGALDLDGSVRRELSEENGAGHQRAESRARTMVNDRGFLAMMKRLSARQNANVLRARILRYLERQQQPELSDIHIVRRRDELSARMPRYVVAYLKTVLPE